MNLKTSPANLLFLRQPFGWSVCSGIRWSITPESPTIHDSIVTTISYKDKVRDVMKSVLSETMGVAPILAVELFEPKAAYEALEEMTEFNLDDYFK